MTNIKGSDSMASIAISELSQDIVAPNPHGQGKLSKLRRACQLLSENSILVYMYGAPLILMWLPICVPTPAAKCAFVLLVMTVYWLTECVPMSVTGLLPALLLPAFGIIPSKLIASLYMKDTMMLFVATIALAAMLENTGIHARVAAKTLIVIGQDPSKILLGLMLVTWFCSMWMNNTGTTVMMLPTVDALLEQLRGPMDAAEHAQTKKMLGLAVAYSASIGGVATITGSGTNLILLGQLETIFHTTGGLNFGTWAMFSMPLSLIMVVIAWIWLQVYFLGFGVLRHELSSYGRWFLQKFSAPRKANGDIQMNETQGALKAAATRESIFKAVCSEYEKLGPMRTEEYCGAAYFVLVAVLWLTREPSPGVPGWGDLFPSGMISDTPATLFVAFLCFMTPAIGREKKYDSEGKPQMGFLVTWKDMENSLPVSLLFLAGGGFAISEGCKLSGLNSIVVDNLKFLEYLPSTVVLALLIVITAALTEITSNVAICSILMPMLAELAMRLHLNPLQIMFPTTIACSFAFMLPVATPPNAIVYSKGYIKVREMARCGIGMNVIAMVITVVLTITYGNVCLDLSTYPDWADRKSPMTSVRASLNSTWSTAFENVTNTL